MPDDTVETAADAQTSDDPARTDAAADRAAALDAVADELYGLLPDEFVGGRDAAVTEARERGDRELAKAISRLRRPTRAAWLANLLARHRPAQLDGLLGLAAGLADAQRTLDGAALRQLTVKRHQLVAAMAREAGRLAQEAGDPAAESVLRELQGILDAALARPEVAEQVRSGRLTRTLSYTGFGPEADPDAVPTPAARLPAPVAEPRLAAPQGSDLQPAAEDSLAEDARALDTEAVERARVERLLAERQRREEALAQAEDEETAARERQDADEAAREDTAAAREEAHQRVIELAAALEAAREQERAATAAARDAETAAKASARAAGVAATRTARARARLEEIQAQL